MVIDIRLQYVQRNALIRTPDRVAFQLFMIIAHFVSRTFLGSYKKELFQLS